MRTMMMSSSSSSASASAPFSISSSSSSNKSLKTTRLYDINQYGQLIPTKEISSLEKVSRLVPKYPGSALPSITLTGKGTVMTHPVDLLLNENYHNNNGNCNKSSGKSGRISPSSRQSHSQNGRNNNVHGNNENKDVIVLSDSDEENCDNSTSSSKKSQYHHSSSLNSSSSSSSPHHQQQRLANGSVHHQQHHVVNPCTNTPDCECNTIFKCRLCEFASSYSCQSAGAQIQNHLNSHGRGVFIMRESLVTSRLGKKDVISHCILAQIIFQSFFSLPFGQWPWRGQ